MVSEATYRYEISKNARALCQNTACKADGVKIQKGELRFGTLVDFMGNQSWRWKHWGCVTPYQIGNIVGQIGGLDGLDLDEDLGILDGWEDLTPEAQEKIKQALRDGHVADEDWKGDPELNRPGMKGINKRTPNKKKAEADDEANASNGDTPVKKTPAPKKRKAATDDDDVADAEEKPKRKPRAKKVKTEQVDEEVEDMGEEKPKRRPRAKKAAKVEDSEEEVVVDEKPKPKARAKKAAKVEESEEETVAEKPKAKFRAKKVKTEEQDDDDHLPKTAPAPPKERATRPKKVKDESTDELALPDIDSGIAMAAALKDVKPAKTKGGRAKRAKIEKPQEEDEEDVDPLAQLHGATNAEDVPEVKEKAGKKKAVAATKGKKTKAK